MASDAYKPPIFITGTGNATKPGTCSHNEIRAPELQILGQRETDHADGSHTVCIPVEVVADVPPERLAVHVIVDGLISADMMRTEPRRTRQGSNFFSADITRPAGNYEITLHIAGRSHIQLNAHF